MYWCCLYCSALLFILIPSVDSGGEVWFCNTSIGLKYHSQDRGGRIANMLETGLNLGTRKFARSGIRGDVAPSTWYNYKPEYNEDKAKEEIIKLYGNNWTLNERPDTDDPLIQAAYDKWFEANKYNWDLMNKLEGR